MTAVRNRSGTETIGRARLEALSDGIFAIVLTLLVLELKIPHVDSAEGSALPLALTALAPKFASWVISFVTVTVIWLNHHRLLALTGRIDHGLFWWHMHVLLWTSFVPFPTALVGDYPHRQWAVSLYGLAMAMLAVAFVLARWHVLRQPDLLGADVDHGALRRGTRVSIVAGPVAYALGATLAWLSPWAAMVCYVAIPVYFVVGAQTPRRLD